MGGACPPLEALPPLAPPSQKKKNGQNQPFWHFLGFLPPPQKRILPPSVPPQKKKKKKSGAATALIEVQRGGGGTRLPKFKFSANFPIGLHLVLQLQI